MGLGGHAGQLAKALAPEGAIIGLDADPSNLAAARARLADAPVSVTLRHANFAHARRVLDELGVDRVAGLLADLGVASSQLADPERGFSFESDAPLDMRFDPDLPRTAADLVGHLDARALASILRRYGEEPHAGRIGEKIVATRAEQPITTCRELARVVREAVPEKPSRGRGRGVDPATRSFMALRIAVNGEMEALDRLLEDLPALVAPGGRVAVISFHSLEDRAVKRALAALAPSGRPPRPIQAEADERDRNPRSRSAKLRSITMGAPSGG